MEGIKTDILIVGAGPSGLMLACLLIRQGTDFIIIDKATEKIKNSGALVIHAASMEILSSLGLIEKVLRESTTVTKARLKINEEKVYSFDISAMDNTNVSYPAMILLEQFKLEEILTSYLESAGMNVLKGNSLHSVHPDSGINTSLVLDDKEAEYSIVSKFVIGADGKESKVRELMNIPHKSYRHQNPIFIIDYEGEAGESPGEISFSFNSTGSFGSFPLKSGYFRLDAAIPGLLKGNDRITFEDIRDYLPKNIRMNKVRWFSVFYSNYLLCDTFRSGNTFLIGDAAHTHNPVGGQGLNSGFQDALNLGWKLSYVIKGLMHENILDTYTTERRPIIKKIMARSDFIFRHITDFNKTKVEVRLQLTTLALKLSRILLYPQQLRTKLFEGISQLWISYSSQLILESPGSKKYKAGKLLRYQNLPVGYMFYYNYKLLILSKNHTEPNHPILKPFPLDIINITDLPDNRSLIKKIDNHKLYILLRPDNFIAMVTDKLEVSRIIKYFKVSSNEKNPV